VLLVRICKLGKIPSSIIVIFLDHSITLAGNNIYSDMKTLQKDYPKVVSVLKTRGKHSITNIGLFARRRDIVYSGNVGLQLLVKRLLSYHLPKNNKDISSDWNKNNLTV
jgi:hypothetical protein